MNLKYEAIIFDVDGVLVNVFDDKGEFTWCKDIDKELGLSMEQINKFFAKYWNQVVVGKLDTLKALKGYFEQESIALEPKNFLSIGNLMISI